MVATTAPALARASLWRARAPAAMRDAPTCSPAVTKRRAPGLLPRVTAAATADAVCEQGEHTHTHRVYTVNTCVCKRACILNGRVCVCYYLLVLFYPQCGRPVAHQQQQQQTESSTGALMRQQQLSYCIIHEGASRGRSQGGSSVIAMQCAPCLKLHGCPALLQVLRRP